MGSELIIEIMLTEKEVKWGSGLGMISLFSRSLSEACSEIISRWTDSHSANRLTEILSEVGLISREENILIGFKYVMKNGYSFK